MTLLFFFFVPQGETKLKTTLDRTAPMTITVELRARLSHQMRCFYQITRMRVSVILLDLGPSYFVTFCPAVFAHCHLTRAAFGGFSVLVITSLQRTTICFISLLILLGNSIPLLQLMYLGKH